MLLLLACNPSSKPVFTALPASETGIGFENRVTDTDSLNILDYLYYYNGGGVAIGDINNDGLPDIYFSSNKESNRLYLNKGNLKFEDITASAGVAGSGNWKTGVTIVDVNADGWPDIYVSEVGGYKNMHGRNELFINNGRLGFSEQAHAYGLDIQGFNTQAVFLDYDHDGDLDMFLVNHSVHSNSSYGDSSVRHVPDAASGDKLFRNDARPGGRIFTEVTAAAGIYSSVVGYGLNAAVADLNNDGWDDIYVSNDFHENDYYYLNNHNGGFTEINRSAFGHESRFSMGSAIADMNNDGWQDIITLDMLPADEKVLKSSAGDDPLDIYNFKYRFGYYHQYARNCLQLNVGAGKKFSDVALYAGIAATDWSWSPLAADFDNDGVKDLFISNGILHRQNDLDYIKFFSSRSATDTGRNAALKSIANMPDGVLGNYMFRGTADLHFQDKTAEWGIDQRGYANGAAYADLDNDGDLDIVVNRINAPALVYQNNTARVGSAHYIDIKLQGDSVNPAGIGAVCVLRQKDSAGASFITSPVQINQLHAGCGFQSASLQYLHFGLGAATVIDSLQLRWPDGKTQTLTQVHADQRLVLSYKNAVVAEATLLPSENKSASQALFRNVTDSLNIPFHHQENNFNDFNIQAFIPHMVSTQGPKMAVADIDGDGLDDFYVCGAMGQPGALYRQTANGQFVPTNEALLQADAVCEDVNAVFFDADGDGDKDLYVVSGGNEMEMLDVSLFDRLYINDGKGNFTKTHNLPPVYGNKSVAVAADIDHDGDLDLFVGGRVIAGRYGDIPDSYIFLNDGKGHFSIAGEEIAAGLRKLGMVTDAVFTDIDADGWPDLVIVGDWMPVTVFKNEHGKLLNRTAELGLQQSTGLWNTISAADINHDGAPDLLLGNWGENSKLHASAQYPLKLYVGDLDNNGSLDQLLALEHNGKYYSFLGKEDLEKQLPALLRKNHATYAAFASQTVEEVFGDKLVHSRLFTANTLSSMIFMNNRKGGFSGKALPAQAQWTPLFSLLAMDINNDQRTDILAAGNFYGVLPYEGRYDAGYGTAMLQDAGGNMHAMAPLATGFMPEGEVRDIKLIRTVNGQAFIAVARNNNSILFYRHH